MSKRVIKIESLDSAMVERLFYLSYARRDNVAFLMKDDTIRKDLLKEYSDEMDKTCVELEIAKREISNKYMPLDLKDKKVDYSFDFEESTIVYECEE